MRVLIMTCCLVMAVSVQCWAFGGFSGTRYATPNAIRILKQTAVQNSLTGTVAETQMASVTVPGGAMNQNGAIRITVLVSAGAVNANAKTLRIKWGSGSVLVFSVNIASAKTGQGSVIIRNRNSTASQVANSPYVYGLGTDASNAPVTAAANTAADQSIVITGQLASTGDTLTLEGYTIELLPST